MRREGLRPVRLLQRGSTQERGTLTPRANAPPQAARHPPGTLPVFGRVGYEIRRVKPRHIHAYMDKSENASDSLIVFLTH